MSPAQRVLLEQRDGWDVGRDPRQVSREEMIAAGHKPMSPLKALRARCIDCCADQPSEVRLCTAVACASWPFRMGVNPWRKEATEAQREQARTLMHKRHSGSGNQRNGRSEIATSDVAAVILPPENLSTGETVVPSDTARWTAVEGEAVR